MSPVWVENLCVVMGAVTRAVCHVVAMVLLTAMIEGWMKPINLLERDRTCELMGVEARSFAVEAPTVGTFSTGVRGTDLHVGEQPSNAAAAAFFYSKRNKIVPSVGLPFDSCSCTGRLDVDVLGNSFFPDRLQYMVCDERPCYVSPYRCQPLSYSVTVLNSTLDHFTVHEKKVVVGCTCSRP